MVTSACRSFSIRKFFLSSPSRCEMFPSTRTCCPNIRARSSMSRSSSSLCRKFSSIHATTPAGFLCQVTMNRLGRHRMIDRGHKHKLNLARPVRHPNQVAIDIETFFVSLFYEESYPASVTMKDPDSRNTITSLPTKPLRNQHLSASS